MVVQPQQLTQILEYSNLFFSGFFAVEMLLKVVADGLCGYIRVGFNVFDGFIVILRHACTSLPGTRFQYSHPLMLCHVLEKKTYVNTF